MPWLTDFSDESVSSQNIFLAISKFKSEGNSCILYPLYL